MSSKLAFLSKYGDVVPAAAAAAAGGGGGGGGGGGSSLKNDKKGVSAIDYGSKDEPRLLTRTESDYDECEHEYEYDAKDTKRDKKDKKKRKREKDRSKKRDEKERKKYKKESSKAAAATLPLSDVILDLDELDPPNHGHDHIGGNGGGDGRVLASASVEDEYDEDGDGPTIVPTEHAAAEGADVAAAAAGVSASRKTKGRWDDDGQDGGGDSHARNSRRRRHDSDDSDGDSGIARGNDSDKEVRGDGKHADAGSFSRRSENKRRRRHDTDSEDDNGGGKRSLHRRMHDGGSSDDDDNSDGGRRGGNRAHDRDIGSDGKGGTSANRHCRRERLDSSSTFLSYDDSHPVGMKGKRSGGGSRHKSDLDDNDGRRRRHGGKRPRRRHDSDDDYDNDGVESDDDNRSRNRNDSPLPPSPSTRIATKRTTTNATANDKRAMSSGHSAGLQDASAFRTAERKIQSRIQDEASRAAEQFGTSNTVYRDKSGRKVNVDEMMERLKQTKEGGGQQHRRNKEYDELNDAEMETLKKGRAQRQREEDAAKEAAAVASESFARGVDDARLDDARRHAIRKGDPMAAMATASASLKTTKADGVAIRPTYKGPRPKPNRYDIYPGYRWDGVDRGNGFEDKVLSMRVGEIRKKEEMYRLNVADM